MSLTVAELRALFTADVAKGVADLKLVDKGLDKIDGRSATAKVNVRNLQSTTLGMNTLVASIAAVGPALVPMAAVAAGALGAVAGPMAAAGLGVAALGVVAAPALKKIAEAADKGKEGLKGLNAEERAAVGELKGFRREWRNFYTEFEPDVFDIMGIGIGVARKGMALLRPLVAGIVPWVKQLGKEAEAALGGKFWKDFAAFMGREGGPALYGLAHAAGDVAKGLASLLMALQPLFGPGVAGLRKLTSAFAEWAAGLSKSKGFETFLDYLRDNGPLVGDTLLAIASAVLALVKAAAPLGPPVLMIVKGLAELVVWLGKTHPAVLQAVLVAVQLAGALRLLQLGVIKVLAPFQMLGGGVSKLVGFFRAGEGGTSSFGTALGKLQGVTDTVRLRMMYAKDAVVGWTKAGASAVKTAALATAGLVKQAAAATANAARLVAMKAAQIAVSAASKAWAAAQWLVNAALTANPIGIVIVVLAALVAGIVIAYKRSETFRSIVHGAFHAVATAGQFMWDLLKRAFGWIVNAWLSVASTIIHGAAKAFGWIPGLGGKLKGAAAQFDIFRARVNAAINGVKDHVTVTAHIAGGDAAINKIAALRWQISRIPRSVTVNVLNKVQHIPMRAAGGPVTAGQPYIVGERRPELFVPSQNGRIEPRVPGQGEGSSEAVELQQRRTNALLESKLDRIAGLLAGQRSSPVAVGV